jgi:hypothetical protein
MAFPAFGTSVPTLTSYQASFRGYTFGAGTVFELQKIEGADLPSVRSGDNPRPRDHGLFVGLDVMGGRELTFTGQLRRDSTSFAHALQELGSATIPGGVVQEPLFVNFPGFGTLATLVRPRKRSMPQDIQYALGELANVVLMFQASDPRWYGTPTQSASVSPPSTTAGFKFNITFPLSFGGGSVAGALTVNNMGNIETRPLLIVEGPCENPSITQASTGNNLSFTNLTMSSGDKLEIDTDLHTATFFVSGSTIGSTRLYKLVKGSRWFTMPPGETTFQFLSGTGEGKLEVQWASAYEI